MDRNIFGANPSDITGMQQEELVKGHVRQSYLHMYIHIILYTRYHLTRYFPYVMQVYPYVVPCMNVVANVTFNVTFPYRRHPMLSLFLCVCLFLDVRVLYTCSQTFPFTLKYVCMYACVCIVLYTTYLVI